MDSDDELKLLMLISYECKRYLFNIASANHINAILQSKCGIGDKNHMVKNLFREISMSNIKGYEELTEQQKDTFDTVYKQHVSSLDSERRLYFTEENIEEIKAGNKHLNVYFSNGQGFKYKRNNTWEKLSG